MKKKKKIQEKYILEEKFTNIKQSRREVTIQLKQKDK